MNKLAMIHPDHLLDGARRGALAPEAWQALGAHLSRCRACAFEHSAAADFSRARKAGARALDAAHLDRLVDGALARAALPRPPRVEAPARASAARWIAAAAMIVAAASAFAILGSGRSAHRDPAPAAPSEATLDAGAAPLVGGDA